MCSHPFSRGIKQTSFEYYLGYHNEVVGDLSPERKGTETINETPTLFLEIVCSF